MSRMAMPSDWKLVQMETRRPNVSSAHSMISWGSLSSNSTPSWPASKSSKTMRSSVIGRSAMTTFSVPHSWIGASSRRRTKDEGRKPDSSFVLRLPRRSRQLLHQLSRRVFGTGAGELEEFDVGVPVAKGFEVQLIRQRAGRIDQTVGWYLAIRGHLAVGGALINHGSMAV